MTVLAVVALAVGASSGLFLIGRALLVPKTLTFYEFDRITSGEGVSVAQALAGNPVAKRRSGGTFKDIGMFVVRVTTESRIGKTLGLRSVEQLAADLKILDKTIESHVTSKVFAAVSGFAMPILGASAVAASGGSVPVIAVAFVAVGLGVGGFFYPDWGLVDDLAARRLDFRQALSIYMDLVTIYHAGSYGIRDAMIKASERSGGWAFGRIRRVLVEAGHRNQDEAIALLALGEELGVSELVDFGIAVSQTSSRGAVVQETLVSRSDIIRERLASDAESEAAAGNEKMALPLVMLVMAFLLFIGFGALNSTSFTSDQQITNTVSN